MFASFFSLLLVFSFLPSFMHSLSPGCNLPKFIGPCSTTIPRFFYNTLTSRCEGFIYGGCGGNINNFETFEACETACVKDIGAPIYEEINWSNAFCLLAPEVGPCKAYFVRYYYDAQSGICENFVYGGCGGNANNFEDGDTCMRTCN